MKIRTEFFLALFVLIISVLPAMWDEAVNYSYSSSYQFSNYPPAARWLAENMAENESALVPFSKVFEAIEPSLGGRLRPWSDVWNGAGVFLEADNNLGDFLAVRKYLMQYVKQEKTAYLVNSPNDPYCARLLNSEISDELVLFRIVDFHTESSLWNEPITVYQFASARREILNLNLTTEPSRFETNGDISVSFGDFGMSIVSQGDSNVYIPIFVNSSPVEKLLLTVYVTQMSLGAKANMVLYLDKDGDGSWGGWDLDTGVTVPIPQKPAWREEMMFIKEFYKIQYNVIQIGLAFYGEASQALTIRAIGFYEAYEPST